MVSSEELRTLQEKIDQLERLVRANSHDCAKMSRHIDFVECVYRYLRSPLCYMARAFGIGSPIPLPLPRLTGDRGVGGEHAVDSRA